MESAQFDVVNLGALISDISSGATPKVDENYYTDSSGIPFLRVQNVPDEGIDLSDVKFITRDVHNGMLKRSQLKKDDLVFTITGRIGSVAVVPDNFEGNINQHSVRFQLKTQIANIVPNPRYVAIFLNLALGQSLALREGTGGTRPALDYKALYSLRIILPPTNIQNHIVSILRSAYDQKKQKEQEADALLDSIDDYVLKVLEIEMPSVEEKKCFSVYTSEMVGRRVDSFYYQSKFRNVDQIMENVRFDVFNLGALIRDISSGVTPKVDENYYTDSSIGVPFLRVQNVTSQGIDLIDAKFITLGVHNGMLKRSQLKKDDLVFTITGRIGSVAVVPDNFEGNINQHSVRFHLKERITNTIINPNYVAAFLNSELGKSLSIREVTGGTRPALDYKALKSLPIILPSIEIQDKIVTEIKKRLAKVEELRREADAAVKQAKERVEWILLQ